jgi:hypothetical protein
MYSKTGKLDNKEKRALEAIKNNTSTLISIRLLQYLDEENLINLEFTWGTSTLTKKGEKALEQRIKEDENSSQH